jgi:choline dehydrogenase-like flavoprotein
MSNINIDSIKSRTYDAIVIGSGISGGWAAKELCDHGIKTLMLERGRDVRHIVDYPTTLKQPWEYEHRGQLPLAVTQANPIISRCYAFYEGSSHFFVKDNEHPYIQDKPFDWIRGYQVGGKSLMWARWSQRWSDFDYEGPARDGYAVDWPIRYADMAPWYSHVEKFAGIAGNRDGIPTLPDGEFLPPFEMSCVEKYFKEKVASKYPDRYIISSRVAHLTQPQEIHLKQGRGKCVNRTICERGCPYGGYFSSNSSTLPWAMKTGKLTLRPQSVVHSILYDAKKKKAIGVKVIDAITKEEIEFYAKIIFVNASALNSNLVLLNSTSSRFPNGLGNDSGVLGKYVAFHNYRPRVTAEYDGFPETTTEGRSPSQGYVPRFRNVYKQETGFLRGYAAGFSANKAKLPGHDGLGTELKENLNTFRYSHWHIDAFMMGETIPKKSNQVTLDANKKDDWGIPMLKVSVGYDDNDEKMILDFHEQFSEMFTHAGFKNIKTHDSKQAAGLDIHEMGGVRMGVDPKTSMLNKNHQLHTCPNVYVTDGSCMTSTSTQNPSLTYMAFSARAANHAVEELKKRNL